MMKLAMTRAMVLMGMMGMMSCGTSPSANVPVHVSLSATKSVLTSLAGVGLTISGADMTTVTSTQKGPFTSDISISLDVPIGSSRVFTSAAAISGVTTIGYQGTAKSDVVAESNTIPIGMNFMNFATSSTTPMGATNASGAPEISSVSAGYDAGLLTLTIDFATPPLIGHLAGVVEFLPKPSGTPRSQSIINELKGTVDVTMPAAGTNYMMFNGTTGTNVSGVVNSVEVVLYDSNDQPMKFPVNAIFTATMVSQTSLVIATTSTAFQSLVDPNMNGALNILVGTKPGPNDFLTPTKTAIFTATGVAVGSSGGNIMLYDSKFDTTSLQ